MERVWITNGSTGLAPIVNPLAAACHRGYVPDRVYFLDNPSIADRTDTTVSMIKSVVTAHDGAEPDVEVHSLDEELDFDGIIAYLQSAITTAREAGGDVAIDVTPGRKFWSIISFRAGFEYDVDHLYYVHLKSSHFYELCYPEIPRTAIDLVDFTEVVG